MKIGESKIQRQKSKQYEMAYRMADHRSEIMGSYKEPDSCFGNPPPQKLYGPDCLSLGTYAANCLLASENSLKSGVRFCTNFTTKDGISIGKLTFWKLSIRPKIPIRHSAQLVDKDLKQRDFWMRLCYLGVENLITEVQVSLLRS